MLVGPGQAWVWGPPGWRPRLVEPGPVGPGAGVDPVAHLLAGPAEHRRRVEAALAALRAGESYQICLTDEARWPWRGSSFAAHRRRRRANPAPHGGLLRTPGVSLLASSPERFLRVDEGWVETRPIKGTAPREHDPARLRADLKLAAENLIITDLLRNDLGRVCEPGSVVVEALAAVESHAHVHHLVSAVSGRLSPGARVGDVLAATFPGGSMTGAPKHRTLELLDALEQRARGPYAGAFGWIAADATACDLAITIRTAVLVGEEDAGEVRVGAGGGIVLDSDPDDEVAELVLKLRSGAAGW